MFYVNADLTLPELRERLRRLRALADGTTSQGERAAAEQAIGKVEKRIAQMAPEEDASRARARERVRARDEEERERAHARAREEAERARASDKADQARYREEVERERARYHERIRRLRAAYQKVNSTYRVVIGFAKTHFGKKQMEDTVEAYDPIGATKAFSTKHKNLPPFDRIIIERTQFSSRTIFSSSQRNGNTWKVKVDLTVSPGDEGYAQAWADVTDVRGEDVLEVLGKVFVYMSRMPIGTIVDRIVIERKW